MRSVFSVLFLLISVNLIAQSTDSTKVYVCPPCGLSCDLLKFDKTGQCHICHMQLIGIDEIDEFDAGSLQPLKEKGVFYLIIFFGIFQGLILFVFLAFSRRAKSKKSNKYLALLVLSLALGCAYYLILEYRLIYKYPWMSFLPLKLFYVYGTTLYLYIAISIGKSISRSQILTHFFPGILVVLLGIIFIVTGASPNSIWYGHYNLLFVDIGGSVHAVVYFILSFRLVNRYNHQIDHHVSNDQMKLIWLQRLMIFLVPFFTLWMFFLIYSFIQPNHLLNNYMFFFWIFAGILIYWIGYRGFVQPELFIIPDKSSRISDQDDTRNLNPYIQALENAMKVSKLHLNPTLTRQNVAEHLKISPNQLSYILNSLIGKSFYDFVNEFRVSEVTSKIKNPDNVHLTLEGIAYESGFNSKSTFNATFKKVTGMTPKEYKKNIVQ